MKKIIFSLFEAFYSLKSLIDPALEGDPYKASKVEDEYIVFRKPSFSLKTSLRKRMIYRM